MKKRIKKSQIKHFTRSEEEKFRKVVENGENPRDKLNFDILFDTGLRLSELTGLNVEDVMEKDYLTIIGKGMKERTLPIGSVNGLTGRIRDYMEGKKNHGESTHP